MCGNDTELDIILVTIRKTMMQRLYGELETIYSINCSW